MSVVLRVFELHGTPHPYIEVDCPQADEADSGEACLECLFDRAITSWDVRCTIREVLGLHCSANVTVPCGRPIPANDPQGAIAAEMSEALEAFDEPRFRMRY